VRSLGPARRAGLLWLALAVAALASPAGAQAQGRGQQVYQLCAMCHGDAGEGKKMYHAPAIAGLQRWYIEAQLRKFKEGTRAYRAEDVEGLQMRPMARSLVKDEDLKAVAAYVASLRPVQPPPTLAGDPVKGKAAYVTCLACHGEKAGGNEQLNAPSLAHQADWYLVAQINKFRAGLRGTHAKDATGAQMRPMAMTMPDEETIRHVVAYIRSLAR
jgi:cytochrome c oxidase subunit 2